MEHKPPYAAARHERGALYYKPPAPLRRPFKYGQLVDVRDRGGATISVRRIARVGPRVVVTDCGRRWSATTGKHLGALHAWPFPYIRHSRKRSQTKG